MKSIINHIMLLKKVDIKQGAWLVEGWLTIIDEYSQAEGIIPILKNIQNLQRLGRGVL